MRRAIAALMAALVVTSCGGAAVTVDATTVPLPPPEEPTTTMAQADDLAAARSRWAYAGLDTYRFVLQDDCGECDPAAAAPQDVVVWDGDLVNPALLSVEEVFDLIESAMAEGRTVEATYDPKLGNPTEVWIDREARVYDGGTHLLIDALSPGLPGTDASVEALDAAWERWRIARPEAYEYRTDIVCECPFASTVWTSVAGGRVVDWSVELVHEDNPVEISPLTIDRLFEDLRTLFGDDGGSLEGALQVSGSAAYDPKLGHPAWVGLDIEVIDEVPELADFPSRLIFVVRDLIPHDVESDPSELDLARERWSRADLVSYRYELTVHDIIEGSFGPTYVVEVDGGVVTAVTTEDPEAETSGLPIYTIDELFDRLEHWQAAGQKVDVLYDTELGHPVVVVGGEGGRSAFSIDALTAR